MSNTNTVRMARPAYARIRLSERNPEKALRLTRRKLDRKADQEFADIANALFIDPKDVV